MLKLVVDKLDDVPEAMRGEYTEKDGKFHLNVDIPQPEDSAPLRRAIEAERKARAALEAKIKSWEKLGKTPDEIEALVTEAVKAEENKLTQAGEWDKLKAQMNAKHADELKALQAKLDAKDGEIKSMRNSLESHLVDAQATAAIAAQKGVPELLLPTVQKFVKVVESDGRYAVKVVDSKGDPRVNGKGDPLTVSDLISELKSTDTFGRAFEGTGNSGSGTRPTTGTGGTGTAGKYTKRSDFKTERERAAFVDEQGLEAYMALPAN